MQQVKIRGLRDRAVYTELLKHPSGATATMLFEPMKDETSSGAVRRSLRKLTSNGLAVREGNVYMPVKGGPAGWPMQQLQAAPQATTRQQSAPRSPSSPASSPAATGYRNRKLAGIKDVEMMATLRDAGIYVLLYGPPGTGKTALVLASYEDVITVSCDENTTTDDFLGQWSPDGEGGFFWTDGPLVTAMRKGWVLFIDDITLAPAKVLAVVYPAMDGRMEITVKSHVVNGKPEVVQAAPGFYVVGAHNPRVHGALLTEALASRFTFQVKVGTDLKMAQEMGVPENFLKLSANMYTKVESGALGWAPQLRELLAVRDIAKLTSEATALANLYGMIPEDDREVADPVVKAVFGRVPGSLELG